MMTAVGRMMMTMILVVVEVVVVMTMRMMIFGESVHAFSLFSHAVSALEVRSQSRPCRLFLLFTVLQHFSYPQFCLVLFLYDMINPILSVSQSTDVIK